MSGGSSLRDGIDPYEHLSAKAGAADRCPHCGGVGRVVPDEELRHVCSLCGGPRFGALADGIAPPEAAERALVDAQRARKARAAWTAAAAASGAGAALTFLVAAVLGATAGLTAAGIVGAIFVLPFSLALFVSLSKRSGAAARVAPALDAAWSALAASAAHAGKARSPEDLARALGVGAAQAEQLHTVLAVDAELGAATERPRVRIGDTEIGAPPRSALAPDPRFEALERAAAREADAEAELLDRDSLARAKTVVAPPDGDGST